MTITITIRKNGPLVIAPDLVSQVQFVDHATVPTTASER